MNEIERLHKRQVARLLSHLDKTGQLTLELEKDIKRAYGYIFEDFANIIQRQNKEKTNGTEQNDKN